MGEFGGSAIRKLHLHGQDQCHPLPSSTLVFITVANGYSFQDSVEQVFGRDNYLVPKTTRQYLYKVSPLYPLRIPDKVCLM